MKLPIKEDYEGFIKEFTKEISEKYPKDCFYLYGSAIRDDCDYGRSDIDGGLILNSDIVTDKDKIFNIAHIFAEILRRNNDVKTQFNLLDRESSRDGRFLSYTTDYTDHFKQSGKVCCGPNYFSELNGLDFKSGCLDNSAFNFRRVRNTLLYSIYFLKTYPKDFIEKAKRVIENTSGFPKKLLWLRGEDVIPSRHSALTKLEEILGDVDLTFVEKINILIGKPEKYYKELSKSDIALQLLSNSVEAMEIMIKSYIEHFPEISERELMA